MNYLIVSPVRSGSTWLNLTLAKHLNLTNVGEALCKISPTLVMNAANDPANFTSQLANDDTDLRKLTRAELIIDLLSKRPFVAKITPWDLYDSDDEKYGELGGGLGYEFDKFKEYVKPLTTIFLYRKNLLEHYISFWGVHRTGVMNTYSRFMNYKRPRIKYTQEELDLYLAHRQIWEQCYKDHSHNFDYTISYEELFKMDELCGVPLKQYHEEFTLKLNSYTEEELEECKQQTGLEDNYEIC